MATELQAVKMSVVKKVLAFGSLGFTGLTFFSTLGLIAAFAVLKIDCPADISSANQVSLGAFIGCFVAVVNSLLGD